ncbi:DegV family protein [Prevotella sp.]|uniref:DegV family protein n=1 Tax=Prevotella sp. TaxID=59823 RepID=UPI002F93CE7E
MLGGITLDIKLICDSLCDIPDEIMAKDYLEMIPLTLMMDGKEYKDGIDITKEEFYVKALEAKDIPKTSQATYIQFKDAFDRALAEGKKVLCITGASTKSGTYQSAMLAKSDTEGDVFVFDTENLSLGAGQSVIRACDLIEEGLDIEEILERLVEIRDSSVIFFAPASFDFLKKSGRVPLATAILGNMLSIRPLFKMEKGEIEVVGKVRGVKKLISAMMEKVIDRNKELADITITIGYGSSIEDFQKLAKEVEDKLKDKVKKVLVTKGGVCICSHTGPDIIAISCSK